MVEIGMGREARRTYELEDVAIVPSRRTRSSKDVDAWWSIDAYEFGFPLMMHPTDSVSGPESAAEFARQHVVIVLVGLVQVHGEQVGGGAVEVLRVPGLAVVILVGQVVALDPHVHHVGEGRPDLVGQPGP